MSAVRKDRPIASEMGFAHGVTMTKTTIQLDKSVRDELRDHALPDESANDTVKRLLNESEPPQMGVDATEAKRIAERVFERKARELR
jgi:hypothetical protein